MNVQSSILIQWGWIKSKNWPDGCVTVNVFKIIYSVVSNKELHSHSSNLIVKIFYSNQTKVLDSLNWEPLTSNNSVQARMLSKAASNLAAVTKTVSREPKPMNRFCSTVCSLISKQWRLICWDAGDIDVYVGAPQSRLKYLGNYCWIVMKSCIIHGHQRINSKDLPPTFPVVPQGGWHFCF